MLAYKISFNIKLTPVGRLTNRGMKLHDYLVAGQATSNGSGADFLISLQYGKLFLSHTNVQDMDRYHKLPESSSVLIN